MITKQKLSVGARTSRRTDDAETTLSACSACIPDLCGGSGQQRRRAIEALEARAPPQIALRLWLV